MKPPRGAKKQNKKTMNKQTTNKQNQSIMKKYFIFAAAAVVAMAACSKVEDNFDLTSPSNKIAFVVADYSQQTKAPTSLATGEDAIFSFKTTLIN